MTMPVRRASKFSAKRRAVLLLIIFQSLIPQAIPGFCEPWSECQPEESRPGRSSQVPGKQNSKCGSSVQMTMPVRRASTFSTKRRAVLLLVIFSSMISQEIPAFCEPWSKCQPEESRPPEGRPEDSSIYIWPDFNAV